MKQNPESTAYFYQNDRTVTLIQGTRSRTVVRTSDFALAEKHNESASTKIGILATDHTATLLQVQAGPTSEVHTYTAFGHDPTRGPEQSLLGFTGALRETSGFYLLGNGYRAYNTTLTRFHSPDSLSPFGKGGLNAYGYCLGDPVNNVDPSGHNPLSIMFRSVRSFGKGVLNRLKLRTPSKASNMPGTASPKSRESIQTGASEPPNPQRSRHQNLEQQVQDYINNSRYTDLKNQERRIENNNFLIENSEHPTEFMIQELNSAKAMREGLLDQLNLPYDFYTNAPNARGPNYLHSGSPRSSMSSIRSSR